MKRTRVPRQTYMFYKAMYPELPESYVRKVLEFVKRKAGRLDAITVNYYMRTSLGKVV
jgi:hypothetical protein